MNIKEILNNPELIEIGRKAVEDTLIEFRDARLSQPFRGNGLVCKEPNGELSSVIRLGIDDAVRIALTSISKHLEEK